MEAKKQQLEIERNIVSVSQLYQALKTPLPVRMNPNRYIPGTTKFPYGENSLRRQFLTPKTPYSENSVRRKIRTAKKPTPKNSTAKNLTAKNAQDY